MIGSRNKYRIDSYIGTVTGATFFRVSVKKRYTFWWRVLDEFLSSREAAHRFIENYKRDMRVEIIE